MEPKTYTVKEVIEMTIRSLYGIRVPVEQIEEIGMPISMAIGNLKSCLEAMAEQEKNTQKAGEAEKQEEQDEQRDE